MTLPYYSTITGFSFRECSVCAAVIPEMYTSRHDEWHRYVRSLEVRLAQFQAVKFPYIVTES